MQPDGGACPLPEVAQAIAEQERRPPELPAQQVCEIVATACREAEDSDRHTIVFMPGGPVRHLVAPEQQALARPFTHSVTVQPTGFRSRGQPDPAFRRFARS